MTEDQVMNIRQVNTKINKEHTNLPGNAMPKKPQTKKILLLVEDRYEEYRRGATSHLFMTTNNKKKKKIV